jgi:hypothetical protein
MLCIIDIATIELERIMIWDYRIIEDKNSCGEISYSIHEVYYEVDVFAAPIACTYVPTAPTGSSTVELQAELDMIQKAFSKPVIDMQFFDDLDRRRSEEEQDEATNC